MQKICDDKAEELYDFILESQRDYPGSYPQLATSKLDEKRQGSIQKQVVPLQSEFTSLGKYDALTDLIQGTKQRITIVFDNDGIQIRSNVCT